MSKAPWKLLSWPLDWSSREEGGGETDFQSPAHHLSLLNHTTQARGHVRPQKAGFRAGVCPAVVSADVRDGPLQPSILFKRGGEPPMSLATWETEAEDLEFEVSLCN